MSERVNLRLTDEESKKLEKVIELFGLDNIYGAKTKAIKQSLTFVLEFHELVWEIFDKNYGTLCKNFIKRKLLSQG